MIARTALTLMILATTAGPVRGQAIDETADEAVKPLEAMADTAPGIFAALHGTWSGDGTLMGRPAAFELEWAHRGAFASLHFTNAFASADRPLTPVMQAAAVYRTSPDDPHGSWLDSRGVRFDLEWAATDSSLVVEWRGSEESGRTTYLVRGPDVLEVVDEVRAGDGWRVFARASYGREGDR